MSVSPPDSENVPSLSIIFPTHNEETLMARALVEALSLQAEYPAPVEIIVACNGCTDKSADIARLYPVTVLDVEECGMSFGNNLGGKAATNELLLFWDVDTFLAPGALAALADTVRGHAAVTGSFWTLPDKPSLRAVMFFFIMNQFCQRKKIPQAGTVFITRSIYEAIEFFDESIPQGTGSDLARRATLAGATYTTVMTHACRTSVRRFEKRGYLRQLLEWRRNIRYHSSEQKDKLAEHDYDVIR